MNEQSFLNQVNQCMIEYQSDLSSSLSIPMEDILLMQKGKRYRSLFLYYNPNIYSTELKVRYASYIELIHTASLLHDDIIDHSNQRRGLPTLNSLYSLSTPISVGFYLFSKSIIFLSKENSVVYSAFCDALKKMSLGQIYEIQNQHSSFKGYLQIISLKTSPLFALASGIVETNFSIDESQLGYHYGIAFQMIDDVLDYMGDQEVMDKPLHLDIQSDLYTLPIILEKKGVREDQIYLNCRKIIDRTIETCKRHRSSVYYTKPIQKLVDYSTKIRMKKQ
ncbi:MAG TPA: polyprenyl synthetase family protein [Caldisericia bacterium]|nr:polyprenyl synthetase family protein [Caldisericia bacterium]